LCNISALYTIEAAEGADFPIPNLTPIDPEGVAWGVAEIKVAFNIVLLTGITVVCMTCACQDPF